MVGNGELGGGGGANQGKKNIFKTLPPASILPASFPFHIEMETSCMLYGDLKIELWGCVIVAQQKTHLQSALKLEQMLHVKRVIA